MFTKRIIPCLDVKDGRVVKGVNFVDLRDAGDPVELASVYDHEGADEVIFLGWFAGGEVFRAGLTFRRENGRIFYSFWVWQKIRMFIIKIL